MIRLGKEGEEKEKRLDKNPRIIHFPFCLWAIHCSCVLFYFYHSFTVRPISDLLFPYGFVPVLILCQRYGDNDPIVIPTRGLESSFPNLVTSDNFPLFPFTDQFNTGMELNPANKIVSYQI